MNASVKLIEFVVAATATVRAEIPETHPSAQILGTERHGTGVTVDSAGLLLTVNYLVLGASTVEVTLLDDTEVSGRVVAQDFATGLAVIDIGRTPLATLPLCASTGLQVGQDVFIVAATDDNTRRLNNGVISSLGRFDAYWEYALECAITTTAMNPGLGGGPLFDTLGRIVGVVSLDLNDVGRFTLAIPIDPYLEHREELLRHGHRTTRPARAWIGFYCYTFRDHVVIAGVLPGAPGDQAGLRAGDVVLTVDGQRITERRTLYSYLWSHRPGDQINFRVFRNNHVAQVAVPSGNAEEFFA